MAAQERAFEDWQIRQCRTFARWGNMHLTKKGFDARIAETPADFSLSWTNGVMLMRVVHALYDIPMPRKYKKNASTRVHCLDNVNQAMKMLANAEVPTTHLKQVNLLDGDFNMMCGMMWNIILDYNIKGISVEDATAKQGLLIWCRKKTQGYQGINGKINNFSTDWKNGNAFLALVDRHTTDMVDYDGQYADPKEEKLDAAFTTCEALGIARLLEIDDLTVDRPDEKAVMTYVSELFKLFSKEDIKENAANHISKFLQFQRRIDGLAGEYEDRFREFEDWVNAKCNEFGTAEEPATQIDCGDALTHYKGYLIDEKPPKMADVVDIQDLFANIQGELKVNGRSAYQCEDEFQPSKLNELVMTLQNAETEYIEMVRNARLGFIEKLEDSNEISEEKLQEFNESFDHFDADNSGHMNKLEFKAALSAVGIALSDPDCDRVYSELSTGEGFIERETYINYLVAFFSTSDNADSIMKSFQILGDPENLSDDMMTLLTEEDREYLNAKAEDGSLAAFISASFADQ